SSLRIGPAEDPGTKVGPVIDKTAQERLQKAISSADPEHGEVVALSVPIDKKLEKQGTFVGPTIITGVHQESRLAQEELFGPILVVMKAKSVDEAFQIANNTRYALTGGVYSRSPSTLRRARREFQVGNLYLNREITGAMVQRHPFGGFRMSGIGSKAGGPDYLLQFLIPVNVSENTVRRGFAPSADPVG
ncbi:MAG: aldehyde dehydrogenase family protein, partial [Planctomycetaceae bacterium]|nr:aldehyde dehydrogenase family protein [Planctomycetaceae bacterium]